MPFVDKDLDSLDRLIADRDTWRERAEQAEAELSIAREALEMIERARCCEMDSGCQAEHLADIARAALARLQAKEEGT